MKIITWNCNGALRKKLDFVDSFKADILVIQECEDPSKSTKTYRNWANDYLWTGLTKNRGIGVFARNGNRIKELNWDGHFQISGFKRKHEFHNWKTSDLKLFLPFTINDTYTVLGAWTKGSDSEVFGYVGQFWKYLQIHDQELSEAKTIIVGDFNSNAIWDKSDRWWNHSGVIQELRSLGIESLYHYQTKESQGNETLPTFYLHRNEDKPYHIDYVFLSSDLLKSSSLEIGKFNKWIEISDHMPIIASIGS